MYRSRVWVLVALGFLVTATVHARVSEKNLPPSYRHWLTVEVPYIIESAEREQFLQLRTDAERDSYIQQFWESRNSTPGSETNAFKEEHYRRFTYANEHYGDPRNEDGWRTDQGRIYITLGEPQQRTTYPNARNVRPLIAWFYKSPSPALPPYFYMLFYKRSGGETYTLYSPYQDGPTRLTTGLEDLNVQNKSLQTIRKSLGDEVARLAVTLIPAEPADLNNYSPSMTSDVLLSTIRGLPDNYLQKQQVAINRSRERVTASILTSNNTPEMGYVVTRDAEGRSTVNTLIEFREPDPALVGERRDKTTGYELTLRTHITTKAGKLVYDQVDVLSGATRGVQVEIGRKKPFAAEGRFPLVPGTYEIQSTLTNNLNLEAHRLAEKVEVPERKPGALVLSEPFVFSGNPVSDGDQHPPFSLAGLRFSPRAVHTVLIHPGDRVPCVFQIWLPAGADGQPRKDPIQMHYLYGTPALGGKPLEEIDENVEASNADAHGSLVSGHTFTIGDVPPGSYRLLIRATQAGSAPAFASMTLRVVPGEAPVGTWSAYAPPEASHDAEKRELAAAAQGRPTVARQTGTTPH